MVPATVSAIGVATVNARAKGHQHWELRLMPLLSHSSRVEGKLWMLRVSIFLAPHGTPAPLCTCRM